jgi:hypothetical protein
MSYEDLAGEIAAAIDAAVAALAQLADEERTELVARVEGALGFARVSLEMTEPVLITDAAKQALVEQAMSIADNAADAGQNSAYFEELVAAVLLLPASHGRDIEQAVKEAAANYQRAMAHRIRALEDQHGAAVQALEETRADIATASEEVKTAISDQAASLQAEVDALAASIEAHQSALDSQLVRHTEAFNASLEENARKFQEQTTEFAEALEHEKADAKARVDESAAQVEEVAKAVGVLAGTISLKETANYYEEEAKDQRSTADLLRRLTVVIALGAVAAGIWAVARDASDTNTLLAKLAVSAVLGGLATYTAAQSGKHRRREARAKDLQLQLTAFSPFIAPLHEDLQQAERVRMTRRTFGSTGLEDDDEEEYGPNFLAAIRRILRGEPEPSSGA